MTARMLSKIVSGGQTGVDRAALDVALELGIPCGGWCPKGRRAEDGRIPERYPLVETTWWGYPQRTEWNVRDSDGTLILLEGRADRGTQLTGVIVQRLGKPCLAIDLDGRPRALTVRDWIERQRIHVLNVAGPRESRHPGIHDRAVKFLRRVLRGRSPAARG